MIEDGRTSFFFFLRLKDKVPRFFFNVSLGGGVTRQLNAFIFFLSSFSSVHTLQHGCVCVHTQNDRKIFFFFKEKKRLCHDALFKCHVHALAAAVPPASFD